MKRAIVVVALAVMCVVSVGSSVFAQDCGEGKPQIAIYMTGGKLLKEDKDVMRSMIADDLGKRNWFCVFERQGDFQKVLDKELAKQQDGSIDVVNQKIYEAGKQVAAQYVFVGDVTSSSFGVVLTVRILNVETAQQIASKTVKDFNAEQGEAKLKEAIDGMRKPVLNLLQKK